MELIETIKEIRKLARDIKTNDEISNTALTDICELCDNAINDYKTKLVELESYFQELRLRRNDG